MVTLYNVVSSDWYIARKDGSEDFIPDELWPVTLDVFKKFDVLVMGRKTYETLQSYEKDLLEPFERLAIKKIVISRNSNLKIKSGYTVARTPEDAIAHGSNILVSTGPILNNYLLEKKLVDKVIFHQIPIVISEGIPVFDQHHHSALVLQSEAELRSVKEIKYQVKK